tara:strand:- start:345 stop:1190 length:846 start_codon:yes stop_codon:yes gene_type:complete
MNAVDLFSGIGGFSLGLERAGMNTIAFCEFDKHAQKVLKKHWPDVPIFNDVRTLDGKQFRGTVDVVCGGFPCQDVSLPGKQEGFNGERSSLYKHQIRIISECGPRYAIFENVTGLLTGGSGQWFARFLYDLAEIGFDAEWHCISASYLGAPHHRDRVWVVAYPNSQRRYWSSAKQRPTRRAITKGSGYVPYASSIGSEAGLAIKSGPRKGNPTISQYLSYEIGRARERQSVGGWSTEPGVGRVANGIPSRTHRLKQLGNAVVPQIPEAIGRAIMEYEKKWQ